MAFDPRNEFIHTEYSIDSDICLCRESEISLNFLKELLMKHPDVESLKNFAKN